MSASQTTAMGWRLFSKLLRSFCQFFTAWENGWLVSLRPFKRWEKMGDSNFSGTAVCTCTLRTVGFSCASRERNHCEQLFDFPSSMCEVRHTPRDVFDITSSHFAGNHYTAGSPKHSSYVAERTRKRQNKFTNSFYRL